MREDRQLSLGLLKVLSSSAELLTVAPAWCRAQKTKIWHRGKAELKPVGFAWHIWMHPAEQGVSSRKLSAIVQGEKAPSPHHLP